MHAEVRLIQTGVCGLLYAEVGLIQTGVCGAGIKTDDNYDDDEDEDAAGDDITAMMRTKMLPVMITDGCMMCVAFCFLSIFLHGFIIVSVRTYINEEMHGAITHASIGLPGACGSGSDTDGGYKAGILRWGISQ